ncbi:Ig-like domain-containing protein [Conexibacter stalactiti]|uniref:Ig-like domain-containing protein n=1 Tax=Conexibacter stalactiti TaxID=1940611 RepID=A0ABU4HXF4_9ACTN|nr:Ig-like domain-containing protein [Conexibacter stalactiti]MDW5597849.1 Ig-like domain-containing protein [Conexibacter stalactiti]MEC5038491.1 Ig-like domain-containing protein [Conexibacter stalactiti]
MTVSGNPSAADRDTARAARRGALILCMAVVTAIATALLAAPAFAITPERADDAALAALGSARGSAPVIVFRTAQPLEPGTAITQAGATRATTSASAFQPNTSARRDRLRRAGATVTRAPEVLRVGGEAAWLYYEDRGPFQLYQHPGRIALVGVHSGDVRVSRSFDWPPLVAGRLPLYLRNAAAYRDDRYRAFERLPQTAGGARTSATATAASTSWTTLTAAPMRDALGTIAPIAIATAAGSNRAAGALARGDACAVTVADMLDNSYDYASVDRTRAAVGGLLADLERRDRGFVAARYSTRDGLSPAAFVTRLIRGHRCRSVLLFIAGGGVRGGQPTINLGASGHADGRLEQQDLRAAELRALLRAHPQVEWQLLVDAPYAGGLIATLKSEPNLRVLMTASESDEPTYACIPELRRLCGTTAAQLAFTSRVLSGIDGLLADPTAVDRANASTATGIPFLSTLLTEGYSRGAASSSLKKLGVHPQSFFNFPRPPPGRGSAPQTIPLPPFAQNKSVSTNEDTAVRIDLASDLIQELFGDFSIVSGPAHGSLSGSGRFVTYTPNADFTGTDSFVYRVRIGLLSSTARVTITVRAINDAPVVTTSAGVTAYEERSPPVAVDAALTVRDVDSPQLTGAVARIGSGYVRGEDLLAFRDTGAIRGRFDAATGTLTLSGRATVADYQAALRSITYGNATVGRDPTAGPRQVTFTATDGALTSAPATKTVNVRAVADPPVVTLSGSGAVPYTENDPATVVDGGLTVGDADSANLSGATVQIVRGLARGEDVLSLTAAAPGGIRDRYDAATGTLTLTGTASLADYQAALRTVAYSNTSEAPSTAARSVQFVATDAGGTPSRAVTRDVAVSAVNDDPTAADDGYTTDAGTLLTVPAPGALSNDRDLDGDRLSIDEVDGSAANVGRAITTPRGATVTVNADGSLSYDPDGAFDALRAGDIVRETFAYRVTDGRASDTATIVFTVTGSNDAPVAADDDYRTDEDTPLTVTAGGGLLANDSDADGDTLTVAELDGSAANVATAYRTARGATLTVAADGSLSYDPDGAFDALRTGEEVRDTVTYRVSDGNGGSDTATATFTITGVNDAPVAADDDYTTDEATPLTVTAGSGLLANDSDAESDTLTVAEVDGSAANVATAYRTARGATVTVAADGSLSYDPDGQFEALGVGERATDTVTYRVSDGNGGSDTATATFTITGVNDRPDAVDDDYRSSDSAPLTVAAPGLLANDTDVDGDTLIVSEVDGSGANVGTAHVTPRGALVTVNADGSLRYDPNGAFTGVRDGEEVRDSVSYSVSDGNGGSDTATLTVTVTGGNDRPDAVDDAYSTDEDTTVTDAAPGVLTNDRDLDGDTLTVDQVDGSAGNVGRATATARGASVTIDADGALRYSPNGAFDALRAGERATDTVTYRVTDGRATDSATITFTITGANDAPVAADDSYRTDESTLLTVAAGSGVLANDVDAEGDTLTVAEVDGSAGNVGTTFAAASGALVTINADGSLSYDPNGRFESLRAGARIDDTVTYRVEDPNGGSDVATVRFTIEGLNDRPDAIDDAYSTDEDTVLTVPAAGVLTNDSDPDSGDVLAVDQVDGSGANVARAITTTRGASVTINADGSLRYDPNGRFDALRPGDRVTDSVTYRATDGGLNDTATVTIEIAGVNDAPRAVDESYDGVGNTRLVVSDPIPAGEAGKTLTGSVQSNDRDPDHLDSELSIVAERVASRLGGSATIDSDGTFTYIPPTGTTATDDSFDYRVTDGDRTDVGTVTIRLASRVWYVDNTEAAGGTGRSSDAFDTLAEATAASGAGDTIFVHTGSGTTGQNAGAVLDANERLLGEAVDLVVRGDTLYDGASARRPSIGNAAGAGVTLATGSTVQGLAVSAAGGAAISGRAGTAGSTINDVRVTGSSGGLALSGTSGSFDVADTTIDTTGGTGLAASGAGTLNLTSAGTISVRASGGRAVDVAGTALSGTLDTVSATSTPAGGVALQNTTGSIAFGDVTVSASGGTGFLADAVAGLSLPGASTANVSNSGGTAVAIRNNTAPSVTFDTVSATGAGSVGIDVSGNRGGGTTTFSGTTTATTTTATGVSLTSNTGHAIAFNGGGLGITTTSGRGFDATGGGTVSVTGSGNRIASSTGTPLRIANTTIGAADATFQSVAANGAANGIVLDTTGATGNLAVTGTGGAGSGGTIQNIRGADGTTQGIGVYVNAASGTTLRSLALSNNDGWAVRTVSADAFSLDGSTINGTNGTNDGLDEGSVYMTDPTGTTGISSSAISGAIEDNVHVNATRGALDLTLQTIDVGANSSTLGGNALLVAARGTVSARTTIDDSQFRSSREDLVQHVVTDTATSDLTVTDSRLANGQASQVSGNVALLAQTSGNGSGARLTYEIDNNTVSGADNGIYVQKGTGIATADGLIENNVVGITGVVRSGARVGSGIVVEARGQGRHVAAIRNNQVRQYNQYGIAATSGEDGAGDNGTVDVDLTVTGNTVTEPGQVRTFAGFLSEVADPNAIVDRCLDLRGNTLTGSGPFAGDLNVFHDFPANTVRLPGYAGGAQDFTAITNFLRAQNTFSSEIVTTPGSGPGYVNGGSACVQPTP